MNDTLTLLAPKMKPLLAVRPHTSEELFHALAPYASALTRGGVHLLLRRLHAQGKVVALPGDTPFDPPVYALPSSPSTLAQATEEGVTALTEVLAVAEREAAAPRSEFWFPQPPSPPALEPSNPRPAPLPAKPASPPPPVSPPSPRRKKKRHMPEQAPPPAPPASTAKPSTVDLAFLSRRYHSILAAFGATLDSPQGSELQASEITNLLQDKDKSLTGLSLGPSLSWLKRTGLLELVVTPVRRWRLTSQGSAVAISLPPPPSTLTLRTALLSLLCQRASATTSELLATLSPSQIPGVLNIRSVSATLRSLEKDKLVRGDHPSSIERGNGSVSVWSATPQGKRALQENKADVKPAAPPVTDASEIAPSFQKELLGALDHLREILEKQTELLTQAVGSSSPSGVVRFDVTPPRRFTNGGGGEGTLGIRPSFVEDYPSSSL